VTVEVPARAPDELDGPMTVRWWHVAVLAAVLLGMLVLYAVGVLLPYYVNDLQRVPLEEVAGGRHDPLDLWPRNGLRGPVSAAGLAGVAFGPAVALTAVGVGVAWLVSVWRRPTPGRAALSVALVVVVATAVAALVFLLSETGLALKDWRLD
jgi:hypothetical protein